LPHAASAWLARPSDAPVVAWFTDPDSAWGDVIVWKSGGPGASAGRVASATGPLFELYQEWPAGIGFWRRIAVGDEDAAMTLRTAALAWNAALRQLVKVERVPPREAVERVVGSVPGLAAATAALIDAVEGAVARFPRPSLSDVWRPRRDAARGGPADVAQVYAAPLGALIDRWAPASVAPVSARSASRPEPAPRDRLRANRRATTPRGFGPAARADPHP
jgi:hypothetical protein